MERSITIRLPEVLAAKVDRLAQAEGMTQSELVRQALRLYLSHTFREIADGIAREIRPQLDAEGVTEDNVAARYKQERKRKPVASRR